MLPTLPTPMSDGLVDYVSAAAYLARHRDLHFLLLGALTYDAVREMRSIHDDGVIGALALMMAFSGMRPGAKPTIMLAAADALRLGRLLEGYRWPPSATWVISDSALLDPLECWLGHKHVPQQGSIAFIVTKPPHRPHPLVRQLTSADADVLDLSPCGLSSTALRNWIARGWRAFGAIRGRTLLCHALAAYPIGDTEEVAAVRTAPQARRQGLASAVVAATSADICAQGRRATYVTRKENTASQGVAMSLGFVRLCETIEVQSFRAPQRPDGFYGTGS